MMDPKKIKAQEIEDDQLELVAGGAQTDSADNSKNASKPEEESLLRPKVIDR